MQMKCFISCILGILTSCSYPSFDEEWVRDVRLDNLRLSVFDAGKKKQSCELQLSDDEKEKLKIWLKTFNKSHADYNTYVPSCILNGETFQVNIMEKRTVISFRKGCNSQGVWNQYSRSTTTEDQHIRSWLMQLNRR